MRSSDPMRRAASAVQTNQLASLSRIFQYGRETEGATVRAIQGSCGARAADFGLRGQSKISPPLCDVPPRKNFGCIGQRSLYFLHRAEGAQAQTTPGSG